MRLTTRSITLALLLVACLLALPGSAIAQEGAGSGGTTEETGGDDPDPCENLRPWEQPACWVREGLASGVNGIVMAGIGSVFDQLYEWVGSGAAWLLGQLVSLIDLSTRPHVGADWFGQQYRLMGSLAAALVLPLLLVCTLVGVVRQDWRGLAKSYFVYLPAAMVGTAVAVPLVDLGLEITDWMSSLFFEGMRDDIEGFTEVVSGALLATPGTAAAASSAGVAAFLMFMAASVIALGAFAVWVELVLRAAGIYVALFFLPLGFAALVWPVTRKWFGRLVKAIVALILSKFVIVAVIALASAALGNLGTGDGTGFGGVVAGSALMLMAAFSPLVLFRLADVAGDEVASAIEGVTQHRTSPVPTPAPQQSASKLYGRIMQARAGGSTTPATVGAAHGAGATTAGAAAAGGGAAVAAAGVVTAVKVPKTAGEHAGQRLDGAVQSSDRREPGRAEPAGADAAGRGAAGGRPVSGPSPAHHAPPPPVLPAGTSPGGQVTVAVAPEPGAGRSNGSTGGDRAGPSVPAHGGGGHGSGPGPGRPPAPPTGPGPSHLPPANPPANR
jgi:hypothetical protein